MTKIEERINAIKEMANVKLANIRINFIETGFKPADTTMRDANCMLESWTDGNETYLLYVYFRANRTVEHVVKVKIC